MFYRLWLSASVLFAILSTALTLVFLYVTVGDATDRIQRAQEALGQLAQDVPGRTCAERPFHYGPPEVVQLLSVLRRHKELGFTAEHGSIDGGETWKELRRFDPPLAEQPQRLGVRPDAIPESMRIVADFTLVPHPECIERLQRELETRQHERVWQSLALVALALAWPFVTWLVFRWGVWIVRGTVAKTTASATQPDSSKRP